MLGKESCPLVCVAMTPQEVFLSGRGSIRVSALTLINEQVICHTSASRSFHQSANQKVQLPFHTGRRADDKQ